MIDTSVLDEYLEKTTALHHHLCPRQVLGVRIGMQAGQLLGLTLPQTDKRMYTLVETDGCFADGVSVASGCWLGHRTMRLMDYGRVAAVFVDTETDKAVRIWPHPLARDRAVDCMPEAESHWVAQREAYQVMPVEALLRWEPVILTFEMKALISRPGLRVNCSRCGEEILNERELMIEGVPVCRSCAGDGYYKSVDRPSESV